MNFINLQFRLQITPVVFLARYARFLWTIATLDIIYNFLLALIAVGKKMDRLNLELAAVKQVSFLL